LIDDSALQNLLINKDISRQDKLLLCLARNVDVPKQVKDIKSMAFGLGLRTAAKWNLSQLLSSSNGLAVRSKHGWHLTSAGRQYLHDTFGTALNATKHEIASSLRHSLDNIAEPSVSNFVEEAITCYEYELYRSATVLSWIGAVAVLYEYIINQKLSEFNTEAQRRNTKWKLARTTDDLAKMKESDFLDVLESISVIGKNVKQELKICLQLRNGCGHPNSLAIGPSRVAAHIETLVLNVFSCFS